MAFDEKLFGANLTKARKAKGLTQKQAAEKMHITAPMLSGFEQGSRMPALPSLVKLAECYDVSIDELCGLPNKEQEKKPTPPLCLARELLNLIRKWRNISVLTGNKSVILDIQNRETYREQEEEMLVIHNLQEFFMDYLSLDDMRKRGKIGSSVLPTWVESELHKMEAYKPVREEFVKLEEGKQDGTEKEG